MWAAVAAPRPRPAQLPTTIYSAVSYLQNNTHGNSRFVSGLAVAIPHHTMLELLLTAVVRVVCTET